jgi:hypothetical protein
MFIKMEDQTPIVYAEVVTVDNNEYSVSQNMVNAYNLGKSVILFACIDLFFGTLYAIYNPWFFLPLLFALCGYFGAKNYNKLLIFIYGANIFLTNIFRIGNSSYIYANLSGTDKQNYLYSFIMILLCGLLGIWIARIVCRFYSELSKLNIEELRILKLVRHLNSRRLVYW